MSRTPPAPTQVGEKVVEFPKVETRRIEYDQRVLERFKRRGANPVRVSLEDRVRALIAAALAGAARSQQQVNEILQAALTAARQCRDDEDPSDRCQPGPHQM